ncbi:5-hydroxytryptamine receptor 3A-like [Centroberyx affinis]|uniref:5-hydroxytryptamine receptor 3A-like n=1 Tax=Centroberyx affinis TaxID=166261 RepID=UPI003A5C2CA7
MYIGFLLLLFLSDGVSSQSGCSYQDVLNYLNLTKTNELYTMTRPVKNHTQPTVVELDVTLYAILDVIEIDQRFVPYIWVEMYWKNEYISWESDEFCGIDQVTLPVEALWMPDISINEMTEKDKAPPSPYLSINSYGEVHVKNDQVMVSSCKMQIYNFPFDTQNCSLTFSSVMHSDKELQLQPLGGSKFTTEWSKMVMQGEDEWLLVNVAVEPFKSYVQGDRDCIKYTFTMKRRPVLYVVNFLLPILFFLCLDLASFLLSDSGGEKLGFKVTVLLAVTVMQLILNDILPSTSNRIPLIASYCIGIFALMLLSVLETILVMYLMGKDSPSQEEADAGHSLSEDCGDKQDRGNSHNCDREGNKWTRCSCLCDVSGGDTPSELLSVAKEGSSSKLTGESHGSESLSEELRELQKSLALLLSSKEEGGKPGYWTRVAKRINTAFFIFYATAACVFLATIFINWSLA